MNALKLADYNILVNDQVRNILRVLTEEDFSHEILPPYESIRNLVTHIILAIEFNFVNKVNGGSVTGNDLWEFLIQMPIGGLLDHWREMDHHLKRFSSTHMDIEAVFPNFLGVGEIKIDHDDYFTQFLVHTVHHRAQIMSALRLMGKNAVGTDYLFYLSSLSN